MSQEIESGELDALLPEGTVVRIAGNNRTKWDLVGKKGVVRNAQTLGGWHEVVLEGSTSAVRVQRNALEIIAIIPHSKVKLAGSLQGIKSGDQSSITKRRKKKQSPPMAVNLGKLDEDTLRRYRRYFNLNVRKDCEKDELVFAVRRHFARTKVDESDVIFRFLTRIGKFPE
ncbi:hypothetical protein NDN08_001563 [Rhodosorus marinus]|uniref:Histone deacetylase complex subunit SAP30 Sin3 binding domain-containing protein n=1 Tax=Rhodosorus marinus TaxID=101924 RepID=A0AAV8UWY5_9RHOD|nr:hypothetical protein NDN08_001563 [Rhodosorus marinus]